MEPKDDPEIMQAVITDQQESSLGRTDDHADCLLRLRPIWKYRDV